MRAALAGRSPTITSRLCDGAFEALSRGDRNAHDTAVLAAVQTLAVEVDVIVLARASMARVVGGAGMDTPILSSPELSVRSLAARLGASVAVNKADAAG